MSIVGAWGATQEITPIYVVDLLIRVGIFKSLMMVIDLLLIGCIVQWKMYVVKCLPAKTEAEKIEEIMLET